MPNPAQSLILEFCRPESNARTLALEGGGGWLASEVAQMVPNGEVLSLARDVRDVWAAQDLLTS